MNKTFENFREMASCIKKKLFKGNKEKIDKTKINNNNKIDYKKNSLYELLQF